MKLLKSILTDLDNKSITKYQAYDLIVTSLIGVAKECTNCNEMTMFLDDDYEWTCILCGRCYFDNGNEGIKTDY